MFGSVDYWNEVYQTETEPYDWYMSYATLKPSFRRAGIEKHHKILIIGCGTSRLSAQMYDEGFKDLLSTDVSPIVIDQMSKQYPRLSFMISDITNMSQFADGTYDVVIDKGTMDAIFCGANWPQNVPAACSEISRVLKPNGVYLSITHNEPKRRLDQFENERFNWKVAYEMVKKSWLRDDDEDEENVNKDENQVEESDIHVDHLSLCSSKDENELKTKQDDNDSDDEKEKFNFIYIMRKNK
eukprot:TRINITY_DN2989_c0_g1_i2.p1 TRINITY_DN2989_c0_g1~~TRINITY_DN2989_c0_g1_i2.p1  ORF type:complete len:241 (-),score=32.59 TRINITY_DN2989_c0_g1_i2:113-835(-)